MKFFPGDQVRHKELRFVGKVLSANRYGVLVGWFGEDFGQRYNPQELELMKGVKRDRSDIPGRTD